MCKRLSLFFPLLFISCPFVSMNHIFTIKLDDIKMHIPQNIIILFNNNLLIHKGLLHRLIEVTHLDILVREKQFEQKDSLVWVNPNHQEKTLAGFSVTDNAASHCTLIFPHPSVRQFILPGVDHYVHSTTDLCSFLAYNKACINLFPSFRH